MQYIVHPYYFVRFVTQLPTLASSIVAKTKSSKVFSLIMSKSHQGLLEFGDMADLLQSDPPTPGQAKTLK